MSSTVSKAVSVEIDSSNIALVKIDMLGSAANVLTVDLFAELEETFSQLQDRDELSGLILVSAKPNIFVAGADLKRINSTLDWSDTEIVKFCQDGRAVMSRLSQMPFPTVAAIHGACVGGGLEIALWCDYRIVSDDRKTILGLPEVKLGLVPGWAGTVRLPRISHLDAAVDLITSGRVAKPAEALELGFVDEVCAANQLIDSAIELINNESLESSTQIRQQLMLPVERIGDIASIGDRYLKRIQSNDSIYPYACELVLDHLLNTAELSHDEACHGESLAMAKVYGSDPSYGLLNNFFLSEHNKKKPGFVDLKVSNMKFETIGIVGAGLMGRSIARNCLQAGNNVVLLDASLEAMTDVEDELKKISVEKSVQFSTTDNYQSFESCDLVIESVVEVAEVKKTVLEKIEAAVKTSAVIATNTSAIPLEKLADALNRPENFCGIHFCHPDLMQLVEVVRATDSSEEMIANVASWIRRLRKMPVVVKNKAGFVVNRLLAAMLDQAFRLYSWGYGIREIDEAMREFGFLGGPFEIVDVIGSEVCMYAGREMFDGGVKCVTLSPILPRMVKKGWHGRKSRKGFYRYEELDGEKIWDAEIDELLKSYVDGSNKIEMDQPDIARSICSCIVLEASRILDDEIVANPQDIDLCIIHGFSFPSHLGGILFWANRTGITSVNEMLQKLSQSDEKLAPTKRLLNMQSKSELFYR